MPTSSSFIDDCLFPLKNLAFFNTQEGLIKRKTGVLVKHQETAGDIIGLKSYSSKKHFSLAIGNIRVIKCIEYVAPIS